MRLRFVTHHLLARFGLFILCFAAACAARAAPDGEAATHALFGFFPGGTVVVPPSLAVDSVTPDNLESDQPISVSVSLTSPVTSTAGIIIVDINGTRLAHAPFEDGKVSASAGETAHAGFRSPGLPAGTYTLNLVYQEERHGFGGSAINPHPITYYETVSSYSQPLVVAAAKKPVFPAYDQVFQVGSHNSYWVNRSSFPADTKAGGVQERLLDQMLFDNVRTIELDLHRDDPTAGRFSIYHTDNVDNSLCADLEECIKQLRMFHYAMPEHEVVTVVLEFKEMANGLWNGNHHPADLDKRLRDGFGSLLYQPKDFLARCEPGATMQDCAAKKGWPAIDTLRGKFIFTVLGTWNAGLNFTSWEQYATDGGDVRRHAAFPMWAPYNDHEAAGEPSNDGVLAQKAISDSVFLQLEFWTEYDNNPMVHDLLLYKHAVARVDGTWNPWEQKNAYEKHTHIAQTDTPWWSFLSTWPNLQPVHPFRPTPSAPDPSAVIDEPGHRLQMVSHQDNAPRSFAFRSESDGAGYVTWETTPAATRTTHTATAPNAHRGYGIGCLRATSNADVPAEEIAVCRKVDSAQKATISVEITHDGNKLPARTFQAGWRTSEGYGDMLRIGVQNLGGGGGSCVTAYSASEVDTASGQPKWTSLASECFALPLTRQGLAAEAGDVVFVGTKRSGAYVAGIDLAEPANVGPIGAPYALLDLSWPESP